VSIKKHEILLVFEYTMNAGVFWSTWWYGSEIALCYWRLTNLFQRSSRIVDDDW